MIRSTAGTGILVLCLSIVGLQGCGGSAMAPAAKSTQARPAAVINSSERTNELKREISRLQQEEQWVQDQINQTVLEMQGPKLIGPSTRDTVDLADVGRNSADMTAQYEYKNRIKNQRIAMERELTQIEQQSLAGSGGGSH